ncbi:MAG: type II toxin-antitoxin system VapC family toxin [Microscillaceae bacterium]|nr:type II toxin-antitoxin system VapC family toxin [Microscillaceae bacterium]
MVKNYLLDTNILIFLVKNERFGSYFDKNYGNLPNRVICYSYISLGELESIIEKNHWGNRRRTALNRVLKGFKMIPVTSKKLIQHYGQIDAYSQGKLQNHPLPEGLSARNMGKNDLWISATASILEATLITTDQDFEYLHKVFFSVEQINIQEFK